MVSMFCEYYISNKKAKIKTPVSLPSELKYASPTQSFSLYHDTPLRLFPKILWRRSRHYRRPYIMYLESIWRNNPL